MRDARLGRPWLLLASLLVVRGLTHRRPASCREPDRCGTTASPTPLLDGATCQGHHIPGNARWAMEDAAGASNWRRAAQPRSCLRVDVLPGAKTLHEGAGGAAGSTACHGRQTPRRTNRGAPPEDASAAVTPPSPPEAAMSSPDRLGGAVRQPLPWLCAAAAAHRHLSVAPFEARAAAPGAVVAYRRLTWACLWRPTPPLVLSSGHAVRAGRMACALGPRWPRPRTASGVVTSPTAGQPPPRRRRMGPYPGIIGALSLL
jgi:hypothetical protein